MLTEQRTLRHTSGDQEPGCDAEALTSSGHDALTQLKQAGSVESLELHKERISSSQTTTANLFRM